MARPHRLDSEGAYYHVGNRAIARRSYLEKRAEYRFFESRMAYAVRRGEILVLAFALMTTHFHLLVKSLGGLSNALRRIQNEHARRFNRARKRDGPLARGRFFSKRVKGLTHRKNVVLYNDDNPVLAELSDTPEEYEWCSAHLYARDSRPPWLETEWVDSLGLGYGEPHGRLWTPRQRRWRASLIKARLAHPDDEDDPLDDLRSKVPGRVWDWMVRKASLADGTRPGLPVVGPLQVVDMLERFRLEGMGQDVSLPGTRRRTAADLLLIGLLRDLSGQPWAEIGQRVGMHPSSVREAHRHHTRLILEAPPYAELAHDLMQRCIDDLPC